MPLKFREGGKTYIVERYREDINYGASFTNGVANTAGLSLVGPAGGWVFYDRGSYTTDAFGTWRYLECSPNYTDSGPGFSTTGLSTDGFMRWGRRGVTTGATAGFTGYNASGAPVGHPIEAGGVSNSYKMWAVNQNRSHFSSYNAPEATNAIVYCFGLHAGGYSDWYLPSRGEYYWLWWNIVSNRVSGSNSGRGAATHVASKAFDANRSYWSSTEDSADNAWVQNFDIGNQNFFLKSNFPRVRAVRRF